VVVLGLVASGVHSEPLTVALIVAGVLLFLMSGASVAGARHCVSTGYLHPAQGPNRAASSGS
jgi:hypothetical protein